MRRRPDGALEQDVLRVLWAADRPLLPGEINDRLDAGYAHTTIATILGRLDAKGLVRRHAVGRRSYTYAAAMDEVDLTGRRIGELLERSSDRIEVLGRLLGALPADEVAAIRALLERADTTAEPSDGDTRTDGRGPDRR